MSEADEMFKELGYEKHYYKEQFEILYIKKGYIGINKFYFNLIDKNIKIGIDYNLNMQELKAINKKVEELGWND